MMIPHLELQAKDAFENICRHGPKEVIVPAKEEGEVHMVFCG